MGDERSAVDELARNPVMLAEVRQALPALHERATRQAGSEGVGRVIGRRLALLPTAQKSDEEWAAWWEDYIAILGDLPEAALEAGMSAYLRDPAAEWMPLPGRLRALALETPNAAARAYGRASQALRLDRAEAEALEGRGPPVTKELVDELLAGFRQQHAERAAAKSPQDRPPVREAVNETGLTRTMWVHLGIEPENLLQEGEGA